MPANWRPPQPFWRLWAIALGPACAIWFPIRQKRLRLRKLPELAASLFSPKMPPPPTTNPWGGKDITSLAAAREAAKAAELAGGTAEKTPPPAEAEAAKNVDPLRGLKLDATLIVGGKRLAVINGRFYGPQQRLHAGRLRGAAVYGRERASL